MKTLGRILRILLAIVAAIAILFFAASKLPKNLSIATIGRNLSDNLLTQETQQNDDEEPTVPDDVIVVTPDETENTQEPDDTDLTQSLTEFNEEQDEQQGDLTDDEIPDTTGLLEEVVEPEGTDDSENTIEPDETDYTYEGTVTADDLVEDPVMGDDFNDADDLDTEDFDEPEEDEDLVPTARHASITISAAGDCTLGGDMTNGTYTRFKSIYDKYGAEHFFSKVASIFEDDDLTIVNLEGALTSSTKRKDKTYAFRGDQQFVQILQKGSVEVVTMDNNHSQDYFAQGVADTKKALDYVNIGYTGLSTAYTTTVDGITVGFLGYNIWDMTSEGMVTDIQKLKEECDLVIVSIHWGEEREAYANKKQVKLGHAAIDAGADLVLGHHPHVVQGIELYNGKYIVYSLGNFCFGGNKNPDDKDTFIFQQTFTFDNGEISATDINVIPCRISSTQKSNDYMPTPVAYSKGGKDILKKIVNRSAKFENMPDWQAVAAKLAGKN